MLQVQKEMILPEQMYSK